MTTLDRQRTTVTPTCFQSVLLDVRRGRYHGTFPDLANMILLAGIKKIYIHLATGRSV